MSTKYKAPSIKELAKRIASNNDYTSVEWVEKKLRDIRYALLHDRYYTRVDSVAKSGMSRIIVAGYIKNNALHHICNSIMRELAGCDRNGRVSGCGMDMLFATQYNLFMALCPDLRYQDKMTRYNTL